MSVLHLYHVSVQFFPVLDPKKIRIFSSPKPKVLRVSYCDRPLSVARRPSSVIFFYLNTLDFDQTSKEWSLGGRLPKLFKQFQFVGYVGHGVKK